MVFSKPGDLTFTQLISELHRVFSFDEVNVEEVEKILASYNSNPRDWMKFCCFDPHRYTRNLVDDGNGKFNVMILCWGEGMASSIHDHTGANCFVKMLSGTLVETLYDWPEEAESPLNVKAENTCEADDVCYINDTIGLHRMENPSHSDYAVSLHIYIPAFGQCRTFDQATGKAREVKMTFTTKFGEKLEPNQVLNST